MGKRHECFLFKITVTVSQSQLTVKYPKVRKSWIRDICRESKKLGRRNAAKIEFSVRVQIGAFIEFLTTVVGEK